MKITFCGASQEVTGSNYLLSAAGTQVLIDCGLWQGHKFSEDKNNQEFVYDPKEISALVLTHAHLDHCGRLPLLYKRGFRGVIYATAATREFAALILEDSQHLLAEEAQRHGLEPLYDKDDLTGCLTLFKDVDYHQTVQINSQLSFELYDAGHILGSAEILFQAEGKKIIFSGDLGNPPVPILRPTENIPEADVVVMEATYGGRLHEEARERYLLLASAVYESVSMQGVLMIPAFALERTQEIIFELDKLVEHKEIPRIPVFVDSPLAIAATEIFPRYKKYFNVEAKQAIAAGNDIFKFPELLMTKTANQSKRINDVKAPKIIIAGSGMCMGGRILHHLEHYLGDFRSQVLIIGYQVENSLGRKLLDHEKIVKINGREITVKAKVRAIGAYSAHADQAKLLAWLKEIKRKPARIFITHGELSQQEILAQKIKIAYNINAYIPKEGESIDL